MYANLENTDLDSAILRNTNFKNTNLKDANLDSSDLRNASLNDANLEHARLSNKRSSFNDTGLDLDDANLQGASLAGAILLDADLRQANLRGANLQGVDFRGAKLQGSKLQGTLLGYTWRDGKFTNLDGAYREDMNLNEKELTKIATYSINDLACSDKWTAQGVIRNFLFDEENAAKFKTYLIPLLKKKLTDKDCIGIQNLPDDFKQQIKDAIKQQ
jgi:uncharacterized protein YjbI with pentapeptide repeats